jgi:hypothetical protein
MDYELLWNRLKREARSGTDLPFCHGWLTDMMQLMENEIEEADKKPSGSWNGEQAGEDGERQAQGQSPVETKKEVRP